MDTKYSGKIKLYYFGKSWKTEAQIRSKIRSIVKQETEKENSNPNNKACFQIDKLQGSLNVTPICNDIRYPGLKLLCPGS